VSILRGRRFRTRRSCPERERVSLDNPFAYYKWSALPMIPDIGILIAAYVVTMSRLISTPLLRNAGTSTALQIVTVVGLVILFCASPGSAQTFSAKSGTCQEALGRTQKDLNNALAFCQKVVPKEMDIQGVTANDSLVHIKVVRGLANSLMADKLGAEQTVKVWMNTWKNISGSKAVTVFVEWGDVEVAKGQTTILSGDKVTIK
jgi:hypothetical protein